MKKITTNRNKKMYFNKQTVCQYQTQKYVKEEMIKLKISLMNCNFPSVCPRGKSSI